MITLSVHHLRPELDVALGWLQKSRKLGDDIRKTVENGRVEGQILARGQPKGSKAYSQWSFLGQKSEQSR